MENTIVALNTTRYCSGYDATNGVTTTKAQTKARNILVLLN